MWLKGRREIFSLTPSFHFWIEWIPRSRNPVPCASWPALDATSALVRHAELLWLAR
jgi:hypothetical protein